MEYPKRGNCEILMYSVVYAAFSKTPNLETPPITEHFELNVTDTPLEGGPPGRVYTHNNNIIGPAIGVKADDDSLTVLRRRTYIIGGRIWVSGAGDNFRRPCCPYPVSKSLLCARSLRGHVCFGRGVGPRL